MEQIEEITMIITNSDLQGTMYAGRSEYYHTATLVLDPTPNGADTHIVFHKGSHVAVCDDTKNVDNRYLFDGMHPDLLIRYNVQDPLRNKNLHASYRLVNVSTHFNIVKNDGTTLHPVHRRNGNVAESGLWTHQAGIVSEDPRLAFFHIASLELGLIAGNEDIGFKVVLPEPTQEVLSISPDFKKVVERSLRELCKKSPRLAEIYKRDANPIVYAQVETQAFHGPQDLFLEGIYKGKLENTVVVDAPDMRTINLCRSYNMRLETKVTDKEGNTTLVPIEGDLESFDMENLGREYKLMTDAEFYAEDLPRTVALQGLIEQTGPR